MNPRNPVTSGIGRFLSQVPRTLLHLVRNCICCGHIVSDPGNKDVIGASFDEGDSNITVTFRLNFPIVAARLSRSASAFGESSNETRPSSLGYFCVGRFLQAHNPENVILATGCPTHVIGISPTVMYDNNRDSVSAEAQEDQVAS
jgi:hypothetical protein